jgi:hypothetical protein
MMTPKPSIIPTLAASTVVATTLGLTIVPAGASCAIVGDSIAAIVGQFVGECLTDAKGGIPSADVIARVHPVDVLVVSAGSNDPLNPQLEYNLEKIRAKASGTVIWIKPISPKAAVAVEHVAATHHDSVVQFEPGSDSIHPKSYDELAMALRKFIK